MGDAVMIRGWSTEGVWTRLGLLATRTVRHRPPRRALAGLVGLLTGAALIAGCASSRSADDTAAPSDVMVAEAPGAAEGSSPDPQGAASQSSEAAVQGAPGAPTVTGLMLSEGAPGSVLEIRANEPLVWTSFRDAAGHIVVELPNTLAAQDVGDVTTGLGPVEMVRLERDTTAGNRPLVRLVIAAAEGAEHKLTADGNRLLLQVVGDETAVAAVPAPTAPSLAFEPIAEEEAVPVAATPAPTQPAPARSPEVRDLGTADRPAVGPAVEGSPANRLARVEVESAGDPTVVQVHGDGEFAYSTFRLKNPDRFVVDLSGVINTSGRGTVAVGSPLVERVRVAQFKGGPEPVARVVFDLIGAAAPSVERTPDALILRFSSAGSEAMVATLAEEPPPTRAARAPVPPPAPVEQAPVETLIAAAEPDRAPLAAPPEAPMAEAPLAEMTEEEPEAAAPPPPAAERSGRPAPATMQVGESGELRLSEQKSVTPSGKATFGGSSSTGQREYFGEPIDMSLRDADVVETLRSFAKISGLNIVIQPNVSGRVTVELVSVPWDQALEQILRINGLGYEIEGSILRIATLKDLSDEAQNRQRLLQAQALAVPLMTVMKRLSYTNAASISSILGAGGASGVLSQRGSVIVDGRTNTLIIKELPEYIDTVLAIIDNLDEPEPQVMIEARIVETTRQFSSSLGIDWGVDGIASAGTGNSTGLVFPNSIDGDGGVNLLGSAGQNAAINLSLGNILNTFRLDVALRAAELDGLANVLSAPKVATLNNKRASIQSGLQIPVQTVANNTVTVQFVNATLQLDVTPQVTADGTVIMDIQIQKREVQTAFLVPGSANAPIATKEARTQVLVRDGGTAVIGGIYEINNDQGEDRVPGLANVPILGHLFKNKRRAERNTELLIFITPRVMKL